MNILLLFPLAIVEEINLLTFFLRPSNCDKQPGKNATKATKFATKQRARLLADLHLILRLTTPQNVAALFPAPVVINCARLRSRGRWQMVCE